MDSNAEHEAAILAAYRRYISSPDFGNTRAENWRRLVDLIAARSPEQVAQMERAKGLS